ncbi:MAG: hypothetical protein LH475_02375 [Cryobacterium sp.]|uniref:hypothetical protein n=1 Tax=unclassified Cryobacterium TaxID=2649013 RepID=UPI0018CA39ED|nr:MULTISPECIES: hypothetical protein [unclassified Cryobacterium]MCY7403476.1 hypothetical protein [Cryobacterium sp.]MEC5152722.1 hypothetical protein [Cryobacterium sp. CAN_C3]
MVGKRDDDAVSWAGDDDPTLAPVELPEGWTTPGPSYTRDSARSADTARIAGSAGSADAAISAAVDDPADERPAQSSVALVGMGILGGMYLLYTIGWFIGVARIGTPVSDPVNEFMFSLGAWLAVAAPLVWFGVTFWLTTSRQRARLLWLLAGVVLLVPLPLIFGAGVGV